jgi:hypothetical protein
MANKESDFRREPNKRKFKRFTCTAEIFTEISYGRDDNYLRAGGSGYLMIPGPERQKAKVVDLSLGGAKLLIKNPISIGTPVGFRIESFPKKPSITGKANVVWWKRVKPELAAYLMGIAFNDLGWRERFRLKIFVKRLSREKNRTS